MPLAIDQEQPTNPLPIDVESPTTGIPVPPETAELRAFKARFGLSPLKNVSYDEIYKGLIEGREGELRQKYSSELDLQKSQIKQQLISDYARNPENPSLDRNSYKLLEEKLSGLDKPTDPKTVFEENYSREAVSNNIKRSLLANQDSYLAQALNVIGSVQFNQIAKAGDEITAKTEFLDKKAQDIQSAQDEQGLIGKVLDVLKFFDPTYERRKIGGMLTPALMSSVYEKFVTEDLRLPMPQFAERVEARLDALAKDNPGLAALYLSHLRGRASSDIHLDNVLDAVNLSTIPSLVRLGFDIGKGVVR